MLSLAVRNTGKLIREKSKSDNVRLGRLFTKKDTARLMASMLNIDPAKTAYTVLDPSAGTGILSAAVIEEICKRGQSCKQIFLTCYEPSEEFADMLEDNLERIRKKARHDYGVKIFSTVYRENYITDSKNHYTVTLFTTEPDRFDIVISSPPTELVAKDSAEAEAVGGITQVKIGLSFLFMKLSADHVEPDGQLITVMPTTYATASAVSGIRKEVGEKLIVEKLHLFVGVQKNSKRAIPLKKTFILKFLGTSFEKNDITITTSTDSGKNVTALPALPYSFIVDSEGGSLTLPKNVEDSKIVKYISDFPETLTSLGLKMSTGLVIDSKCEGLLFTEPMNGVIPILRPATIKGGMVNFPQPIKRQYLAPVNKSLMQKNKNLIIIKRVPAKSDERFVNSAIYMASQLPAYKFISTHNKINFIDTKDKNGEICARMAFGIFALLNSTIYDRYISIISKSKQINSKEMRSLPLPPRNIIENIGMRLMAMRQTSVKACDSIVNPTLHIIVK